MLLLFNNVKFYWDSCKEWFGHCYIFCLLHLRLNATAFMVPFSTPSTIFPIHRDQPQSKRLLLQDTAGAKKKKKVWILCEEAQRVVSKWNLSPKEYETSHYTENKAWCDQHSSASAASLVSFFFHSFIMTLFFCFCKKWSWDNAAQGHIQEHSLKQS